MGQSFLYGLGAADSSDATATAAQIKTDYTAYVNDVKLTGTYGPASIVGSVGAGHVVTNGGIVASQVSITISLSKSYLVFFGVGYYQYGTGQEIESAWIGKLINGNLTMLANPNMGSSYTANVTLAGTTLTGSFSGSLDDGGWRITAIEITG